LQSPPLKISAIQRFNSSTIQQKSSN